MSLLERIANGEAAAVREIIDQYGDLIWSLASRFTHNDADAEEAVQDIFVLLWRKADQYDRTVGAEVTFVSVLARRCLIDRWRQASRRPTPAELNAGTVGVSDSPTTEQDEIAAAALAAFDNLESEQQQLIRLSIILGCSHSAIAQITGLPLGTVKTRIRTGLKAIGKHVKRHTESGVQQ